MSDNNSAINMSYSSNPFIDYLLYYSKVLAFKSVIKNEDEAMLNETKDSILNGDKLIACIEGNVVFDTFEYSEQCLNEVGITSKTSIYNYMKDKYNIPNITHKIKMYPKYDGDNKILGYYYIERTEKSVNSGEEFGLKDSKIYQIGDIFRINTPSSTEEFRDYKVTEFDNQIYAVYRLRDNLTRVAKEKFIENYVEKNNYYRKLCGLPNIGDYGIPIMDYEYFDVNGIQEFINREGVTYIHELSPKQLKYLESKGILDQVKMDYPEASYLNYITCDLTPYKVRKAYQYQLLYTPVIKNVEVIADKFKRKYEENVLYVMSTFYSDAFKINSDYYTNFMGMMIMIMTITDILSEVHEDIIKKDLLDKRCIQYIFDNYGMPYFSNIPLKYQWRLCKNINKLIRYKSSEQGMINIIDLFGAENIEIFKYFILHDRKVNRYGDLIYNEIKVKKSKNNDIIDYYDSVINDVSTGTEYKLPSIIYKSNGESKSISNYFSKGNTIVVRLGNSILVEGKDYSVKDKKDGSYITILKSGINNADINIGYYYNKEYTNTYIDKDHAIKCDTELTTISATGAIQLQKYQIFNSSYIINKNDIILIIDGYVWGKEYYTIDIDSGIIHLDLSKRSFYRNEATIIYIYSDSITFRSSVSKELSLDNNFKLNANRYIPFNNYFKTNGTIMLFGIDYDGFGRYIPQTQYTVDEGMVSFKDINSLDRISNLLVVYIYDKSSISNVIKITESTETIISDEQFRSTFELHPPFKRFFNIGYKAFFRIRRQNKNLSLDLYDIYNNTMTFRNQSLSLGKGQKMVVTYVGGKELENVICINETINPTNKDKYKNKNFVINIPDGFSPDKDGIIVDVFGNYLSPNKYSIDYNTHILSIYSEKDMPGKNEPVNISYYMSNSSKDKIVTKEMEFISDKKSKEIEIKYPFNNYLETSQSFVLSLNNTILPSDLYRIRGNKIIFNNKINPKDVVRLLYIYNNRYDDISNKKVIIKDSAPISVSDINDLVQIKVPFPFSDYIKNNWYYYVTYDDNTFIPPSEYDIIDDCMTFKDVYKHSEDKRIVFHFIYVNNDNFIFDEVDEDFDKDMDMKFIGVPLTDPYFNKHIINKYSVLSYDQVTIEDKYWDGVSYTDDTDKRHREVKSQILNKRFNYERTKYFGLNYAYNIAQMSFNIAFFYNIFFDDVFKEDKLKIEVPSIVDYKKFNIAYILTYLTALSYLYSGVDDDIIDTSGKILYVRGFNFKADIDKLKKWISDQYRDPNNFDTLYLYGKFKPNPNVNYEFQKDRTKKIWDFDIKKGKDNDFKNMKELVDMFKFNKTPASNKDIYKFIVDNIYKAQNVEIYKIWKKIYDTLMTYRHSMEYYKIDVNGEYRLAHTLSEFLEYKDNELYIDLMEIKGINNEIQRKDAIIDRITDIVYILEEYIDSKTFSSIFDSLPGVSGQFFLDMIFTIINFFKSYKVVLRSKGDYILFNADDPYLNTIKVIDDEKQEIYLNKSEYISVMDRYKYTNYVSLSYKDNINIKEYIHKKNIISDSINPKYLEYAKEHNLPTTNKIKVRIKVPKNEILVVNTTSGKSYTSNNNYGMLNARINTWSGIWSIFDKNKYKHKKIEETPMVNITIEQKYSSLQRIKVKIKYSSDLKLIGKTLDSSFTCPKETIITVKIEPVASNLLHLGKVIIMEPKNVLNVNGAFKVFKDIVVTSSEPVIKPKPQYVINKKDATNATYVIKARVGDTISDKDYIINNGDKVVEGTSIYVDSVDVTKYGFGYTNVNENKEPTDSIVHVNNGVDVISSALKTPYIVNSNITINIDEPEEIDVYEDLDLSYFYKKIPNYRSIKEFPDNVKNLFYNTNPKHHYRVVNMRCMLGNSYEGDSCENIKTIKFNLDTSKVTDMGDAFGWCESLTSLDVSHFDTKNVTNMGSMFCWCNSLTSLDASNFDTRNVTDMNHMFWACSSLKSLDVSNWNTENVRNMNGMFYACRPLKSLDVSNWDTKNVTDMNYMFDECESLTSIDVSHWNTENVTDMSHMFSNCDSLTSLDLSSFDTKNVTNISYMFYGCGSLESLNVSDFNFDKISDISQMFDYCKSLASLDVSNWNTENVKSMYSVFRSCRSLKSLDLSNWDTKNVRNMSHMFDYCTSLTSLDVSKFDTKNVEDMSVMFYYCESLTSLDVSHFDTKNVTDMRSMFSSCKSLTSLDLSSFDTENVINMGSMFNSCKSLTSLDLSNWDTRNVKDMSNVFKDCKSFKYIILLDLSKNIIILDKLKMYTYLPNLTVLTSTYSYNKYKDMYDFLEDVDNYNIYRHNGQVDVSKK